MNPERDLYLASLKSHHAALEQAVAGLQVTDLDTVPVAGANSLAAIVSHAMGSERYLIAQLVGGLEIQRDRAAEFAARGLTAEALAQLIRSVGLQTETILAGLSDNQMGKPRPHREGPRPVRWCLLHTIEHLAEHVGHAGLSRQLVLAAKTS